MWALGCTVIEMATGRPPWPDVADPIAAIHRIAYHRPTLLTSVIPLSGCRCRRLHPLFVTGSICLSSPFAVVAVVIAAIAAALTHDGRHQPTSPSASIHLCQRPSADGNHRPHRPPLSASSGALRRGHPSPSTLHRPSPLPP